MRRLKRALSVLLCILLLLSTASISYAQPAVVATGDCSAEGSNVTWTYYADKTMVISGTGAMSDSYSYVHEWLRLKIEKAIIEEGITHIGRGAFDESTKKYERFNALNEVQLPNTLISIGALAFEECVHLTEIIIPDSVTEIGGSAFLGCSNLQSVKMSENIESISSYLFSDCEKLNDINLPDRGMLIDVNAFKNTAIVNDLTAYEDGVRYVGKHLIAVDSFPNPCIIKPGTKSIAACAFEMTNVAWDNERFFVMADSVEYIADAAFRYAHPPVMHGTPAPVWISGLPSNVKYIGDYAFEECYFINTSVTIPASCSYVGVYAFEYSNLTNVTIENGVREIGERAFWGNGVIEYSIPASVESIGESAFVGVNVRAMNVDPQNSNYYSEDGVLFHKDGPTLFSYPTAKEAEVYKIPDGTHAVASQAFYGAYNVESVEVPKSVIRVGTSAFEGMWRRYEDDIVTGLQSIVFETGERDLVIDSGAFAQNELLSTVVLPAERVLRVPASALMDTAYYVNEDNWENGVLYLGDMLICINEDTAPKRIAVREGVEVIAENAVYPQYVDDCRIDTLPDGLKVLGNYNLVSEAALPDSLVRIGTYAVNLDESDYFEEKLVELFEELLAAGDDLFENMGDYLHFSSFEYIYSSYLLFSTPLFTDDLYIIADGVKFISDGGFPYGSHTSIGFCKGVILPESLQQLPFSYLTGYVDYDMEVEELSATFLNKDCRIYDSPDMIHPNYTICGYTGSTAEAYAQKYNRKFVSIDNCAHELTCLRGVYEATCEYAGSTGDIYCQYCGTFLEKGTKTEKVDHEYGEWTQLSPATCTDAAVEVRKCTGCESEQTRKGADALGHDFVVKSVQQPTCTQVGYCEYVCDRCGETYTDYENFKATGHFDNNDDGYCDECGQLLDATKSCGCMCHKDGILGFFYKIIGFFWKIFKINPVCQCGVAHY